MIIKQYSSLELKCREKRQLRTYIQFKKFNIKSAILQKPLSFVQRKYLSKFCLSCLELKICTGRYINQPESDRICTADRSCSEGGLVESECHFILTCPAYHLLRQTWLAKLKVPNNFEKLNDTEKLSIAINEIDNVKPTAQFIVDAFNLRSRILLCIPLGLFFSFSKGGGKVKVGGAYHSLPTIQCRIITIIVLIKGIAYHSLPPSIL